MKVRVGFIGSARAPAFRLLSHLMIAATLMLTHHAHAADNENHATESAPPAPEAEACSGVQLSLQADCLGFVAQIGRFLDTGSAPQAVAPADVAETVCEQASAPGAACLDTVARMKDWTDATFGSSLPPRSKKHDGDRSIGRSAPQWRAPTVGAYERK